MDIRIEGLGECQFLSPLRYRHFGAETFKTDLHRVLYDDSLESVSQSFGKGETPLSFELTGPRERIFFDPPKTTAAIVTCGGLCPGLNDIIRGIVMELYHGYGATRIYGIRYGYQGLIPRARKFLPDPGSAVPLGGGMRSSWTAAPPAGKA